MFGFLSAKVTPADGGPDRDLGIVSCRQVTMAFADRLVDAMLSSGEIVDHFNQHKQGSGSTAEASGDTALVTPDSVCQAVTGGAACTHGATSNVYRTIGTLVASTAYEIREHGGFCASTAAGSYVLLDRSVVTAIAVNADDTVTWTYNLTIDSETL